RTNNDNPNLSTMEICPMVSTTTGTSSRYTNNITQISNSIQQSNTVPQSKMEDLRSNCIRKSLTDQGFSKQAAELYMAAYDSRTAKKMSTAARKWFNWCAEQDIDPTKCALPRVADFLNLLQENYAYNTIASYRTAISDIHEWIEGKPVGAHPMITKIMRGLYNINPPKHNSSEVVDVFPSMEFLESLGKNNEMPIIQLAKKTAFLIALTTGSRPSDIVRINLLTQKEVTNGL
ncbi:13963_t:CDS:1, partial [Acaulospora morrowiae]